MAALLIRYFWIFLLSCNCFCQDMGDMAFVGFNRGNPVFDSFNENKLYVLIEGQPELFLAYPKGEAIHFIKDDCMISSVEKHLVVSLKGKDTDYNINSAFIAAGDSGNVFITDQENRIIQLSGGKIKETGINGFVVAVAGNTLYYTMTHDPEVVHANADLYAWPLDGSKPPKCIVKDISGESTAILQDGKLIYDEVLHRGKFIPVVYNVQMGKYSKIQVPEEYSNVIPFYLVNENVLVFYKSRPLSFFKIKLPSVFDFKR